MWEKRAKNSHVAPCGTRRPYEHPWKPRERDVDLTIWRLARSRPDKMATDGKLSRRKTHDYNRSVACARARARARAPNTDRIPRARASRLDNSTEIANCRHITREIQICLSRRDTKRTRDATARLAPQYREPKTLAISHGPARHASSPANSPQIEDVCRKLSARDGIRSLT
jgi:hypothetical protein